MDPADFYPRLGPTSEWDIAAGQAVLEAAGGQVVDLDGQALRYNARPTLLNPDFLAYGDPGAGGGGRATAADATDTCTAPSLARRGDPDLDVP